MGKGNLPWFCSNGERLIPIYGYKQWWTISIGGNAGIACANANYSVISLL